MSSQTSTPFAERKPVGLDDAGTAQLGGEGAQLRAIVRAAGDPARGRDPRRVHHLLRERLRGLDPRGSRSGTEDEDAALRARVGDSRGRSRVGSDDDEVDRPVGGEPRHRLRILDVDGDVLGDGGRPAVAGRDDDLGVRRVAAAYPCQRVLAASTPDDENSHDAGSARRAARHYSHSIVDGGLLEMS